MFRPVPIRTLGIVLLNCVLGANIELSGRERETGLGWGLVRTLRCILNTLPYAHPPPTPNTHTHTPATLTTSVYLCVYVSVSLTGRALYKKYKKVYGKTRYRRVAQDTLRKHKDHPFISLQTFQQLRGKSRLLTMKAARSVSFYELN